LCRSCPNVGAFIQSNPEWFDDYVAFANLFNIDAKLNTIHHAGNRNGKELYLGWITGEEEYLKR